MEKGKEHVESDRGGSKEGEDGGKSQSPRETRKEAKTKTRGGGGGGCGGGGVGGGGWLGLCVRTRPREKGIQTHTRAG